MQKNKKKRYAIVAAVMCLALAAGLGTYAWLTATSEKVNTFTVGSINNPDKKPDETNPENPGSDNWDVDGNLIETKWVENSKLVPGGTVAKNPNVGLGAKSDSAYVFVYVKNALVKSGTDAANTPYFQLGSNWTAVSSSNNETWAAKTNGTDKQYISGLFMYSKDATDGSPAKLSSTKDTSKFTGELFSNVVVPKALTKDMVTDKPQMTVTAYIFGAGQKDGNQDEAATALEQAKAWAKQQASSQQ